jgi:ABC-type protease/lipase transport system fused ATPase/permease subunit
MGLTVDLPEFIVELLMEALLIYATFIFWRRYRRTSNRTLLVLTVTFALLFAAHTIFPLIMEDVLGYEFADPFDPHHVFFVITLVLLIYLTNKTQWSVKLPKPPRDDED